MKMKPCFVSLGVTKKMLCQCVGFSPGAWAGQELMLQNLWRYGLTGADMGAMLGRSVSTGARCAGDPQRMYEQPLAQNGSETRRLLWCESSQWFAVISCKNTVPRARHTYKRE
ncbi:MAG TPA: hypothetical protein DIT97_26065 [Gimesia maris]|uniref:Uncharacterized protein n=1 Tax=Gimesia maris TaxID=122 RepID=A0A3D3RDV5_9PLAN|nr:hypothetical protein [Gimesia maris]